jgi:hypothetical protein
LVVGLVVRVGQVAVDQIRFCVDLNDRLLADWRKHARDVLIDRISRALQLFARASARAQDFFDKSDDQ